MLEADNDVVAVYRDWFLRRYARKVESLAPPPAAEDALCAVLNNMWRDELLPTLLAPSPSPLLPLPSSRQPSASRFGVVCLCLMSCHAVYSYHVRYSIRYTDKPAGARQTNTVHAGTVVVQRSRATAGGWALACCRCLP